MIPSSSRDIGAVVVGAGLMGRWHADTISRVGGKVLAIVDSDEVRAVKLAKQFGNTKVYTHLDDALNQEHPTVVHLCTPSMVHHQQAKQVLKAGSHLFVEKPLAPTYENTQDILNLAEQNGLLVCPVHQFIFQDGMLRIKKWLNDAQNITQVSCTIHSAGGINHNPADLDSLVADILSHPLSLLQDLLPGSLETDWRVGRPARGELRVMGTYHGGNPDGIGLAIEISLNARPTQNNLSVATRNAMFIANLFHGFAIRLPGKVSRTQKIVHPFDTSLRQLSAATNNLAVRFINGEKAYPGLRRLVSLFYEAISNGTTMPISVQDTLAVARARQFILAS